MALIDILHRVSICIVSTVATTNEYKIFCLSHLWNILKAFLYLPWKLGLLLNNLCAHCACMAGISEACSHIVVVLSIIEANTNVKQQFSCTSLPCSWLPSSFWSVAFMEISKIDFSTPTSERIQSQKKTVEHEESEPVPRKKKVSIPEPTENYCIYDLSKTKGKHPFYLTKTRSSFLHMKQAFYQSHQLNCTILKQRRWPI